MAWVKLVDGEGRVAGHAVLSSRISMALLGGQVRGPGSRGGRGRPAAVHAAKAGRGSEMCTAARCGRRCAGLAPHPGCAPAHPRCASCPCAGAGPDGPALRRHAAAARRAFRRRPVHQPGRGAAAALAARRGRRADAPGAADGQPHAARGGRLCRGGGRRQGARHGHGRIPAGGPGNGAGGWARRLWGEVETSGPPALLPEARPATASHAGSSTALLHSRPPAPFRASPPSPRRCPACRCTTSCWSRP